MYKINREPTQGVNPADRAAFASFLEYFARIMREHANASVTVAYATWSKLYDVPVIIIVFFFILLLIFCSICLFVCLFNLFDCYSYVEI